MSGEQVNVSNIIMGVAAGLVMLIALRPSHSVTAKTQFGNIVMLVMILLHAALGVGFKVPMVL